jgi:hypothetical protein
MRKFLCGLQRRRFLGNVRYATEAAGHRNAVFHTVFLTDGRKHKSTNPAWYGYSVGKWIGESFEVETVGFTAESWLDGLGLPHSEELRVTERFQRLTAGHLQMEGTIDDPKMYIRPWTFKVDFNAIPDADLIENICENEKDVAHQVAK